jgi:hypothetical protein
MAITGKPSLAYIGVEAPTPPNMTVHDRDPNTRDLAGYRLGDLWLNKGTQAAPLQRLWVLTSKANSTAQWALIISGSGGPVLTITPDGGAPVSPVLGNITINNTDGNILLTNGGPGLILENFANNIFVNNNITTIDGNIIISSRNPAGAPTLIFHASNAGGILAPGNGIGQINFDGFNGVGFVEGAAITSVFDAGGLVANMPANLGFWTKPNNANPIMQRMEIKSTGEVEISAPDSGDALTTFGTITAQTGNVRTINASILAGSISANPTLFSSFATLRSNGGAAVAPSWRLGAFIFFGETGSGLTGGAAITSQVDAGGTVALNRLPSNIVLSTHPDVALVPPNDLLPRLAIASTGEVTINPSDSGFSLTVGGSVVVAGDQGGPVAGTTFTNAIDISANGAGVFTILSKTANNLNSTGFIKIYINGTPFFIPIFSTTTP